MSTQQEKFKAIADAIREKTGETELIKPSDFASKVGEVYDAGKKAEYDAFWDNAQENGTRKRYIYAFGSSYNDENFKPKYDLICTHANGMFYGFEGTNLKALLENSGVELDTSQSTNFAGFAVGSFITVLPAINTTSATSLTSAFNSCSSLIAIEKLVIKDDGSTAFGTAFQNCSSLENLIIEGTIGQNGFDVHWSTKLSKESITSIINALSPTTSGLTVTLSQAAKEAAFTADEWAALIATKPNWTISLV